MRVWLAPQDPGQQLWYVTSGADEKEQRVVRSARSNGGAPSEGSLAGCTVQDGQTVDLGLERYAGTECNYVMVGCKVC